MAVNTDWIKNRIGDELGLAADDLARLYNIDPAQLDQHLRSMGKINQAVYEQLLSDIEGMRTGYRLIQVDNDQRTAMRALMHDYIFHPLVATSMVDGDVGWRLGIDDAQFVAFRTADIVGIDFDWGDMLRLRLHRLIIWPDTARPKFDQAFQDRLVEVISYLVELTGVV